MNAKQWNILWFVMLGLFMLLLFIFGGWWIMLGVFLLVPMLLTMNVGISMHKRGGVRSSILTPVRILITYILATFLIFQRSYLDSDFNPFIFFGLQPAEGSGLDVFLSALEPTAWTLAVIAAVSVFVLGAVSRHNKQTPQ